MSDLFGSRPLHPEIDLAAIAQTVTDAMIDDAIQASLSRAQNYKKWPDDFMGWEIKPYRTDMRNSLVAALARQASDAMENAG